MVFLFDPSVDGLLEAILIDGGFGADVQFHAIRPVTGLQLVVQVCFHVVDQQGLLWVEGVVELLFAFDVQGNAIHVPSAFHSLYSIATITQTAFLLQTRKQGLQARPYAESIGAWPAG
jgi:hypothetical protein